MFSPCLHGFPPGTPASYHLQRHPCQVNWELYIARRCECVCLSLCQPCDRLAICPGVPRLSPYDRWDRHQPPVICPGVPRLSPYDRWDRHQPPVTLNRTNGFRKWMNGWMMNVP
ncbi:hypothetical protein LDENG_00200120 [Lucifuga dentata]|nr:hypothetical protein LDENG_00200120 [Lucifuga dentata]